MGLFSKKKKEVTMRIYRTNQQAYIPEDTELSFEEELQILPVIPANPAAQTEEVHEGLWEKCSSCGSVIYSDDLLSNLSCCPACGHHFRLSARQRILYTVDEGSFEEINEKLIGKNPLDFPAYEKKLQAQRAFTNENEAIVTGTCTIEGEPCVIAVMDGYFMMGSMGAALGEKFTLAAELAIEKKLPFVTFTVSGGARMQEGLISLMQMSKTSAVLGKLDEAGLLYLVVLTDPTTGGVTASFAMLGDVTLAEPNATIGFAGRRVIEQTVKQILPQNFQRAEFLQEKGFVDKIVPRSEMKQTLATILRLHKGGNAK